MLSTMRVGLLHGGVEHAGELAIPPGLKLFIARHEDSAYLRPSRTPLVGDAEEVKNDVHLGKKP